MIGRATNNVAEYRALLLGIERAAALGATELDLVGDSELIVKQVRGEYRVKDPNMPTSTPRSQRRSRLRALVDPPRRRDHNAEADRLVNEALDAPTDARRSAAAGRAPLAILPHLRGCSSVG